MKINELFKAITAAIESDKSDITWNCGYNTVRIQGFKGVLELEYSLTTSSITFIYLNNVLLNFESHTNIDSFRNMIKAIRELVDNYLSSSIDRIISTKW